MSFSDLAATFSSNTFSRVSAYERPFAAATCRKAFRCSRLFNRHIVPYITRPRPTDESGVRRRVWWLSRTVGYRLLTAG